MIDERRLLERAAGRVPPPERVMEGLYRRRERKARNRRIGALALAACLAILIVVGAVLTMRGDARRHPAHETITPSNVAQLREVANDVTFPQQGFRMATGDGVLVMGTAKWRSHRGELVAYPSPCGGGDPACAPLWWSPLDAPGQPTIANGVVYVSGLRGTTLSAFPTDCGTGQALCRPLWTGDIGEGSSTEAPLVVGEGSTARVYVGTTDGLLEFNADRCRATSGPCAPVGRISMTEPVRALSADDRIGVLFVGTGTPGSPDRRNDGSVSAFRPSCLDHAGAVGTRCLLWTKQVGQVWDLVADGDRLVVGTNGGSKGVQSYSTACLFGTGSCRLRWTGSTTCCTRLAVANDTVYAEDQTDHAYAFSEDCAMDGSECSPVWTSSGILGQPFMDFSRPLVSGGLVFVGGDEGWIYSFSEDCAGACVPTSRTFIPDQHGGPGNGDAVTLDDRLYVAAVDGLHVFAPAGAAEATGGSSAGDAPLFYLGVVLAVGAILTFRFARRRGRA